MDNIKLFGAELNGDVKVCSSKSVAHRAIIAGALSTNKMVIKNVDYSKDITATINALKALKVNIEYENNEIRIDSTNLLKNSKADVDAVESGSTLRFLIPVFIALNNETVFSGEGRLPKRPLDDYFELFDKDGIFYERKVDYLPLKVKGTFKNDLFEIKGNTSSQFITGLMLSAIALEREITIKITTELESKPYIDITAGVLRDFGHTVEFKDNMIKVKKGKCKISEYTVERDWSQAAFFLTGGLINGSVNVLDMRLDSLQGDKKIIDVLRRLGGNINVYENKIEVKKSKLKGIDIDASQIPDLVPILSVAGAFAEGTTLIYNAKRLRIKESDRLLAVTNMLRNTGVKVEMGEDYLKIEGTDNLKGGIVNSFNDHRIVMSAAIAALNSKEPVVIEDYKAITKSYPAFFEDYFKIGGKGEYLK